MSKLVSDIEEARKGQVSAKGVEAVKSGCVQIQPRSFDFLSALNAWAKVERAHVLGFKRRSERMWHVLIDVTEARPHLEPFVCCTMTQDSLRGNEWYWGHYFREEKDACDYFNDQASYFNE